MDVQRKLKLCPSVYNILARIVDLCQIGLSSIFSL